MKENLFAIPIIKFTHNGGQITIDSHINEDSVRLHITDTGVGMPPEVIDHLFQIDKDISSKGTNNEKGTGLGLILCKEFIERNGGSITVKSEVNMGSEFIILLPR
ncbi:MAG: ATP-binding protein [Bacteroidales bacterium]|nr:ATP-binding protein [Bacteroidales bacterium]